MGAKSSIELTRKQAIELIMYKLNEATREELEQIADILLDKSLLNCSIIEGFGV